MQEIRSYNKLTQTTHQTVIEPGNAWLLPEVKSTWHYRELLYFLVWRDIKIRYKQTALGVAWVILQPVASMLIFTIIFGLLLKVPSEGVPYTVFAFSGLLPWYYFSGSLTRASTSLVTSSNLITKVYFPRLTIPLSAILSNLFDFGISFLLLIGLMLIYRLPITASILFLPFFLLLAIITSLGFGLWFSALNVRYRDVNYIMPFIVQMWMYLTPVIYSSTLIPEQFRFLLALNPMTVVVEGFRWSLFGYASTLSPQAKPLIALGIFIMLAVLFTGARYFQKTERTFADII